MEFICFIVEKVCYTGRIEKVNLSGKGTGYGRKVLSDF
jgi:hypothetical protein